MRLLTAGRTRGSSFRHAPGVPHGTFLAGNSGCDLLQGHPMMVGEGEGGEWRG